MSRAHYWFLRPVAAITCVAILAFSASLWLLYQVAYERQLRDLAHSAATLANLMESVARFDRTYSTRTHPQGAWGATISQIDEGIARSTGAPGDAELLVGRRVGERLQIMRSVDRRVVPVAVVRNDGKLAQPLHLALQGKRGGGELLDYKGEVVLAGYAPVPSLGVGVVYKVSAAEVRAPYLKAAGWSVGILLLMVLAISAGFLSSTRRLATRLETSERRFSTMVNAVPVGVYETCPDGNFRYANTRWCEIAGLPANEALGTGWTKALHPDDRDRVYRAWQDFVNGAGPFLLEYRMQHPDGSRRCVLGQADAMRDEQGRLLGYTGTITDITERKRMEDELLRSTAQLRHAQAISRTGSWQLEIASDVLTWSEQTFSIFGIEPAEFDSTYQRFLDAVHPDDRQAVDEAYRASIDRRTPYDISHRIVLPDGSIRWVQERGETTYADDGRPLHTIGAVQDITARKQVEDELTRYREHLEELVRSRTAEVEMHSHRNQLILDTALNGFFIVDGEGRIRDCNAAYCRMLGYTRDELTNLHVSDIDANESAADVAAHIATTVARGYDRFDARHRCKDGSLLDVEISVTHARTGAGDQLFVFVHDLSMRKAAEVQLRRSMDAAERASRAKTEFLARMSHELRTPMNAILGFAQVLELEQLPPQQYDFVREIYNAGDHLLSLINELLDLSRIEAGNLVMVVRATALLPVVTQAIQINQPLFAERQIVPINNCAAEVAVLADGTRLCQVLVNLLSNAAKYNRQGGRVTIDCVVLDDNRVRISVSDTGPGIAAEKLTDLFKPFERLGAEFSEIEGTGIGLALSKRLTENMGGELGVDSTPGRGATFWIDLRTAGAVSGTSQAGAPVVDAVADRCTVLYVEDNAANLKVIEAMFQQQPHLRLLSAANGEDGLDLVRRHRLDVVLLDIHLPGMDGYAVLKALRADPGTRDIPVIALSADAMPIDIQAGLDAGFEGYLTKPVKRSDLMESIVRCVRKRSDAIQSR